MDISLLQQIGFSDKYAKVYLALLQCGPSSVRDLAESSGLNRGTVYDALKWMQDRGVVTFYKKESKQHFVAEHPEQLERLLDQRQSDIDEGRRSLERALPELLALHNKGGEQPVARYFGQDEIKDILEDVLETCEQAEHKHYRVYSAEPLRDYLYKDFPSFSDARIAKGVEVSVISVGDGGELRGLDERKWIKESSDVPAYTILYPGKTAHISLNAKGEAVGVVIQNDGIYQTQVLIFDQLWEAL